MFIDKAKRDQQYQQAWPIELNQAIGGLPVAKALPHSNSEQAGDVIMSETW